MDGRRARNRSRGPLFSRRRWLLALPLAAALSATALAATDRQTSDFGFDDQQQPGGNAGLHVKIDYMNPSDKAAKPPAVMTVVEVLATGSKIDTSVPERCTASDQQLTTSGQAACPAGTKVGSGKVTLDSGSPGPTRLMHFDITQYNAADQLVLLFESTDIPGFRTVSRAKVEGRTITAEVPPIPGGPPDNYTALDLVDLKLDAITKDGKHYVTTPPACPASGVWTNQITFTYRDGESQTVSSTSPCKSSSSGGGGQGKPDAKDPLINRIRGLPRHCRRSDLVVRVATRDDSKLASHTLSVDGEQHASTTAKRFRVRIPMSELSAGTRTVSVAAVDRAGNRATRRASFNFRRC